MTKFLFLSNISLMNKFLVLLLLLSGCTQFIKKPMQGARPEKVIIRDVIYENVSLDGTSKRVESISIKINEKKKAPSSISLYYTPGYNDAKFLNARIIKTDGDTINFDISKAKDIPAPADLGGTIFWGERIKDLGISGVENGDILEYTSEIDGGTWLGPTGEKKYMTPYPGYFNYIELFQAFDTPIKYKEYIIETPKEKEISYKIFNGKHKVEREEKGNSVIYTFIGKNIPAVSREPLMGSRYNNLLKLIVTNIPSWKKISQLECELSCKNLEPGEYVKSFTDSLLIGAKSDSEKISRLFYFVSKIRYLGLIEEKREGYAPHKPEVTLKKRSGVCKDKAALLIGMLKAAGFDAYYTITMVGARIENIPSDQTNHAIVGLKWKNRIIYLDPTIGAGGRAWLPPSEWGQGVLMAMKDGDTLRTIPFGNLSENMSYIRIDDKVSNDTLVSKFYGSFTGNFDQRMRRMFAGKGRDETDRQIYNMVSQVTINPHIIEYSLTDVNDFSNNFHLEIRMTSNPIVKTRNVKLFRPLIFNYPLPWQFYYGFSKRIRHFPLNLSTLSGYNIVEKINLSPEDSIISAPENFHYEDKYIHLELGSTKKGNSVTLSRMVAIKSPVIPAEKYPKIYKAVKNFININKGWVIYK